MIPSDIKERFLKVKRGIMRRLIENQARDEALRKWTIPHLKEEIVKMGKMDRIELHEYKRLNNLGFYKGGAKLQV